MNTAARLALVFLLALIVQLTVFVDVRVFGVAPELLSLVAVIAAFYVGPEIGPVIAFAAGLLWDVYLPTPLGVAAITFAVVAYAVAVLNEGLFHDSRGQLFGVVGLACSASVIGYALLGAMMGTGGLVGVEMLRVAVLVGVVNTALAPLAAPVMAWALRSTVEQPR